MNKQIILLNGPSSSGKSTLASTLKMLIAERRNEQYGIVSIDDFMPEVLSNDEPIYEDDVFAISAKLCECAVRTRDASDGVIVDHVITSERIFRQLVAAFRPERVFAVHVDCPPAILNERERKRGDRYVGSAEASYRYLYPKDGYDLTVDTGAASAADCAGTIFRRVFGK